jgi:hypothetical protein
MDMDMDLCGLDNAPPPPNDGSGQVHGANGGEHRTAGIGDTGVYALFKLFNNPIHHVHMGLGFSAPKGSVTEKLQTAMGSNSSQR